MDDNSTTRLDPIDPTRVNESTRWYLHLKEPACVVGEHRQVCLVGLPEDDPQRRKLGELWSWLCFVIDPTAELPVGLGLILAKLVEYFSSVLDCPIIRVEGFCFVMVDERKEWLVLLFFLIKVTCVVSWEWIKRYLYDDLWEKAAKNSRWMLLTSCFFKLLVVSILEEN